MDWNDGTFIALFHPILIAIVKNEGFNPHSIIIFKMVAKLSPFYHHFD